jgi:hypothetical protein
MEGNKCSTSSTLVSASDTIDNAEYKIADAEKIADFDVTLGIDSSKLPKTQSKPETRNIFARDHQGHGRGAVKLGPREERRD